MFLFLSKRDWKLQLFSSGIFFRYTMFFSDVWCAFSWIFFFFYNISNFVIALRKLRIFILGYCIEQSYIQVCHAWLGEPLLSCAFDCSFVCFCRESGPQKEEEKTVVSSARLLRSRFQRPKPNLRMTTSRKEVLDVNNKGVLQKDTDKEESLTQCDSECSILPDTDVRLFFFFFSYIWAFRFVKWSANYLKNTKLIFFETISSKAKVFYMQTSVLSTWLYVNRKRLHPFCVFLTWGGLVELTVKKEKY